MAMTSVRPRPKPVVIRPKPRPKPHFSASMPRPQPELNVAGANHDGEWKLGVDSHPSPLAVLVACEHDEIPAEKRI